MNTASPLSQKECREIAKILFQREDVEVKSFSTSPLNAEFKGFMCDYLKLRVSVSLPHWDTEDGTAIELQFTVKSMARTDAYSRYFAMCTNGYHKEVLFFSLILKAVRKHLRCGGEESCRWLGTVPRCYYLRSELLVLEDLSLLGFRTLDPLEPLTLEQCEGVLRAVARLHGASLVYEEREGKTVADAFPLLLQETLFRKEQGFPLPLYEAHLSCIQTAHLLLDLIPGYKTIPHLTILQLHTLLDPTMEEIYELLKPSNKYRNVLCHRDLWVNNMLFANDANGDVSVRLGDFQNLHLEPPAHDVMIFLHLCMLRDMRNAHSRRLLELYHETLAEVLRQHDLDIDSILPLHVFLYSCQDAKQVAVIVAAYSMQVTMLPPPKAHTLKKFVVERMLMVRDAYRDDERFRYRITETMEELVETCLLPRLTFQPQ